MPGICGIVERQASGEELQAVLAAMLDGLKSESWHVAQAPVPGGSECAMGLVSLSDVQRRQFEREAEAGCSLVLDGELLDTRVLMASLRRAGLDLAADDHAGQQCRLQHVPGVAHLPEVADR